MASAASHRAVCGATGSALERSEHRATIDEPRERGLVNSREAGDGEHRRFRFRIRIRIRVRVRVCVRVRFRIRIRIRVRVRVCVCVRFCVCVCVCVCVRCGLGLGNVESFIGRLSLSTSAREGGVKPEGDLGSGESASCR